MNIEAQELLTKILNKDVNDITKDDIGFLRARRFYIPEEYMAKVGHFLTDTEEVSYKELQRQARERGFKVRVGLTREELLAMINS